MKDGLVGTVWEWIQDPRVAFAVVRDDGEDVLILYLDGNRNSPRPGSTREYNVEFVERMHRRIA